MDEKTYLVCLKPPSFALQQVVAAKVDIYGEHLIFVHLNGTVAAVFLLELVQSWNELSN
jgi:hypothetical protein